ncbi:MAG: DNA replication and repair protein RecF, partial [Leptospira sp.]|nr:DNA replication and repair protein RecF [Leptospira sp.]
IQKLNVFFKQCLNKISAGIDNFEILYSPNVKNKEDFENRLRERLSLDVKLGYTTIGIHRDEIKLSGNGKDIQDTASQGQKRSTVLSLKTAVFKFFKFNSTISPILLIDDVIRELDVDRRKSFIELISDCGQVFFTTTDLDGIQDFVNGMNRQKQIFQVKNKRVMLI